MTKVKICGLSTPEAVQTAVEAGADYIGFVFAPSKRQVTLEQARQLATGIPEGVQKVGVFVSPQREEVEKTCQVVGLDLIQVHGSIDDTILQDLPALFAKKGRRRRHQRMQTGGTPTASR